MTIFAFRVGGVGSIFYEKYSLEGGGERTLFDFFVFLILWSSVKKYQIIIKTP